MEIRHKTVSTPDNQVDGDSWNDKHNMTPLLHGYEFVEEIVASAGSTSVIFSGLDGDTDEEYLLEFIGSVATSSGDTILALRPNNDISASYLAIHHGAYRGGGHFSEDYSVLTLGSTHYQVTSICKSETFISAKSGMNRFFTSHILRQNPNKFLDSICSGVWLNTADNITSLTINGTITGSFSGTFRLWKRIKEVS